MRRALTRVLVLPFAASSVLIGHGVAYRVTGTPTGDLHAYLAHAPQVVLIVATLALLGLTADARARRTSPIPIAWLAISAFVAQEHLERLIHTGVVPFLLASPTFWVGIALQVPLTVAVWWLACRLASDLAAPVRRAASGVGVLTQLVRMPASCPCVPCVATRSSGRSPPVIS